MWLGLFRQALLLAVLAVMGCLNAPVRATLNDLGEVMPDPSPEFTPDSTRDQASDFPFDPTADPVSPDLPVPSR